MASSKVLSISALALLGLTALTGCGGSSNSSSASTTSASASVATSSPATASAKTSSSATASSQSSASSVATVSASSSARTTAAAQGAPAGYVMVTAPNNKLSFAVPDSWSYATLDTKKADAASAGMLEKVAAAQGITVDQLKDQLKSLDLIVASETANSGVHDNVNVISQPIVAPALPAESDADSMVQAVSGTVDSYKAVDTSLGKAARIAYHFTMNGTVLHGEYLILPSGAGSGTYSVVTTTTASAAQAAKYVDVIQQTIQKAQ